jgi:hypothetical protein
MLCAFEKHITAHLPESMDDILMQVIAERTRVNLKFPRNRNRDLHSVIQNSKVRSPRAIVSTTSSRGFFMRSLLSVGSWPLFVPSSIASAQILSLISIKEFVADDIKRK